MIDLLQPFFPGAWASYGESLHLCHGGPVTRPIAQWLENPTQLSCALSLHANVLDTRASKAAVSDWFSRYLTGLLPPIVALCSLLKYRVPAGWHEMEVTLDECGTPSRFGIASVGASAEAPATERYDALVWQHLEPLSALISRQTRLPMKILRGHVRRALLAIFAHAQELVSERAHLCQALDEDCRDLLHTPAWPDGRRNPLFMYQRRTTVPCQGGVRHLTLHASCCLAYQLPRTGYCGACPLAPEHRRIPRRVHNPIPTGS